MTGLKVRIFCECLVFPIHKVILASQSTFFDDLFSKSLSYATEVHYGRRLPTFTLTFGEIQTFIFTNVLEWLYVKRVPSLSNDTVWSFLELLTILYIPNLENIIFQFIEQRVTQFKQHFPVNGWKKYIKHTAFKRPSFLRLVVKTYFIDCNAKDAFEKYEAAKDIIISQSLDQDIGYLIMDIVPFQDLSTVEIKHIVKEKLAPQALLLLEKMDSGVEMDNLAKEQAAIEELRTHLQTSTIAIKPTDILSLASEEIDDLDTVEEFVQEENSKEQQLELREVRLSTSQTLKAASDKLLELVDIKPEPVLKEVSEINLIDPNNSFVDDNVLSDLQPKSRKTGFAFMKFKTNSQVQQYGELSSRRHQSFLVDRRLNSQNQHSLNDFGPPKVHFIPPNYTNSDSDYIKRTRSQSNVPSTKTITGDDPLRRNRSFSTNPIIGQDESTESNSTYSMYNLGDPESALPPDQEPTGKRVGIMELIKGLF